MTTSVHHSIPLKCY